jgi:predicted metal-dependent phosphoesterase TrpH
MRIDMHIHTSDWSDGKATVEEMITAGIANGLDGVVITDHGRMLTREDQDRLRSKFSHFAIFRGAEVAVPGRDHILVVGGEGDPLHEPISIEGIRDYAERTGAFTVLNHPFWLEPELHVDLDCWTPDAIDVLSMNIDSVHTDRFLDIARERNLPLIACSDAHDPRDVGLFHLNLDHRVDSEDELVEAVFEGAYCLDALPELWDARVEEIGREEDLTREVLSAGGGLEDYLARGGAGPGFFQRVQRGASYFPQKRLLGLRNGDLDIHPTPRETLRIARG